MTLRREVIRNWDQLTNELIFTNASIFYQY
uniref:Uncharacterized protein n=1 Tax=Anguilla anguilla TaxID=7936 RepID=A0A0E9TY51_ANGAN